MTATATPVQNQQWLRKANLIVSNKDIGLDLSEMHFTFKTSNEDEQSPSNAVIRVYNLQNDTSENIEKEYNHVTLQAGYAGSYGIIFDGSIRQIGRGKENATDKYLDILAADGDPCYTLGVCNQTFAAGSTPKMTHEAVIAAMNAINTNALNRVKAGNAPEYTGGIMPRGKVLYGMAYDVERKLANSQLMSWSIQNGKVQMIKLDGYLPGQAVKLTSKTGMIGIPEQTEDGIRVRCLLNPKIVIGGQVQIDNKSINQITKNAVANTFFNKYQGVQLLADTSNDGFYRVYVAEHSGDTRGQDWYTDIICLAIDPSSKTVLDFG